jgi:hypothetical protein
MEKIKFKCLLCGRDNFDAKQPHRCQGGFRKRGLKWEMIVPELTGFEMLELGKRASDKADLFMMATHQIREAMKLHKMNREKGAILYVINKFNL